MTTTGTAAHTAHHAATCDHHDDACDLAARIDAHNAALAIMLDTFGACGLFDATDAADRWIDAD